MNHDDTNRASEIPMAEVFCARRLARFRKQAPGDVWAGNRYAYRMKLGRETIRLGPTEYRILRFLAAKPYRAFTRRRIAAAVTTHRQPVEPETLDRFIGSLRRQLGFFRDYVQSVPYIGFRFKA